MKLTHLLSAGLLALGLAFGMAAPACAQQSAVDHLHEGVASCGGSSCHGRQVASGLVVRQNELSTWQSNGQAGAHSRAWKALSTPRAQAIADRLGMGPAKDAPACLGCHADPAPPALRGPSFQRSDGVGCEACHGGARDWLASHQAVGASHAANVARGMIPLDDPRVRASTCLDCHYGSAKTGQFVSHRLMSAGHPRLAFELDLFSELQRHHDTDADYAARKQTPGGVKTWAVGQAVALERALSLYADPLHGQEGAFPEFFFFDCHSCHRAISDDARPSLTAADNPGRPIPPGMPPFNDENMILLSAAAQVAAPALAQRFEADSYAFHMGLASGRAEAVRAAAQLTRTAHSLSNAFASATFDRRQKLALLGAVVEAGLAPRLTDYAGGVQAVMATDTLLTALATSGDVDRGTAQSLRPQINRAYQAVIDPRSFKAEEFRQAMSGVASAVRALR